MIEHRQYGSPIHTRCPHCGLTETEGDSQKRHCLNCDAEYAPFRSLPNVRYSAVRTITYGCRVYVVPLPNSSTKCHILNLRTDLRNHSPTGFDWGYDGSGPAQLALAILADLLGPGREDLAIKLHEPFKSDIIATFAPENWALESFTIMAWMNAEPTAKAIIDKWLQDFPGDVLVSEYESGSLLSA